jgi:hypothetical protein
MTKQGSTGSKEGSNLTEISEGPRDSKEYLGNKMITI